MYISPPTPAICRGSAPEKKLLCGALGGPAACSLATCRVLFLGGRAACSLASCRALSLTFSPCRPSSMSFGHLLEIFFRFQKATLGSRLPLNASRRPRLPLNQIFFWFQKATLGSRLPLNASRRPRLPLSPSRRPCRRSSMSFGHLPDAFLDIFFWFQKATLGSRLPLNASRRPRLPLNQIFFWFQKATLGSRLPLNASRRPRLPLSPSRRPWRPSSMSFGHLPGAFPWRSSSMFFGQLPGAFLDIFSLPAQQHVLWPPAGRFPGDFLPVSESDVRQ